MPLYRASTAQAADTELSALAGLTSGADLLPYFDGAGTATTTAFTSAGRSLVDDTTTTVMRATLGVALGAPNQGTFKTGGHYYIPTNAGTGTTSSTLGNGTMRVAPFIVTTTVAIDRLGAEVTVIGDAASKVRLGIYADDGTGYPGALVVDGGQIAGDSATVQTVTCSATLTPGCYWIGGAVQAAPGTQPTVRTLLTTSAAWSPIYISGGTAAAPAGTAGHLGYTQASVTGALGSPFSVSLSSATSVPRVFFRTV